MTTSGGSVSGGSVSGGWVRRGVGSVLEWEVDRILAAEWDRLRAGGWDPSDGPVRVELARGWVGHAGGVAGSPTGATSSEGAEAGSGAGAAAGSGWPVSESAMPVSVQAALRALLAAAAPGAVGPSDAARARPESTGACPDGTGACPDGTGACPDGPVGMSAMVAVVQAAGAVRGWADAVMVEATAALFEGLRPVVSGGPAAEADLSATVQERALAEARALVVDEVEAATGAGRARCQQLVSFATAVPARTAAARAAMRAGRCEFYRAQVVVQATAGLDPDVADGIAADVLGVRPDGTCWSHRQFRARLRRRVLRQQDPRERRRTHEQAVAGRGVWATLGDDGTGELAITGEAFRVVAARERVEAIARALRRHGDRRTLDQLRSDVALDLLTYGTVPPRCAPAMTGGPVDRAATGRDAPGTEAGTEAAGTGAAGAEAAGTGAAGAGAAGTGAAGAGAGADPWAAYRVVGDLPAARVHLTVSLTTLLGLQDGLGELTGYGPIDADQARRVAFAPGSTWSRIVTDPLTGWAIDRSAQTYRPDAAMAAVVRVRDGTTREPGSTTPAGWPTVDLDHHVPHAIDPDSRSVGGPTSAANLYALTRRAHNRKTRGHWTYEVNAHGLCTWTTATGRTYTTAPADYDELTSGRTSHHGDAHRDDTRQGTASDTRQHAATNPPPHDTAPTAGPPPF